MVSPKLAELFEAAKGAPVELNGKLVRMMYELTGLTEGHALRIAFTKVNGARPQALRMKARGGRLDVNGQLLDDVVLWTDSAPSPAIVTLRPMANQPMSVRMWNAWRDPAGSMQAWIGNSGIVVDEGPSGRVVLRCSDGFDDPTFDDLVVEVQVVPELQVVAEP